MKINHFFQKFSKIEMGFSNFVSSHITPFCVKKTDQYFNAKNQENDGVNSSHINLTLAQVLRKTARDV